MPSASFRRLRPLAALMLVAASLAWAPGAQARPSPHGYAPFVTPVLPVPVSHVGTARSGGITFEHAQIVDPFHLIGEPDIAVDSHGGIYASGPGGTSMQSSFFWKSEDGGVQWRTIGVIPEFKSNGQNGGGDTEITLGKDDTVYASDLQTLQCNSVFRSTDRGHTFTAGEGCIPETDRQWMANYTDANGNTRVYLSANELGLGCYYLVSTDNGLTYLPITPSNLGIIGGGDCAGRMAIDPRNGTIYQPMGDGSVGKSSDGGVTWTTAGNSGAEGNFFTTIVVDRLGNLYQAWTDMAHAYLSVSRDGGKTWSRHQVNRPALKQLLFPWPVVGDPGRVAMVYYATTDTGNTDGYPGSPDAVWNVFAAVSTNALSVHPRFTEVQVNEHPFHYQSICNGGVGCLPSNGDRSLADFFMVDKDRDGRLLVIYNDDDDISPVTKLAKAYVVLAKQRTGPSLFAAKGGKVPLPISRPVRIARASSSDGRVLVEGLTGLPPGDWTTDPAGDASWPVDPVTAPSVPAMDIRAASVGELSAGTAGPDLSFVLDLADLSQVAQAQAAAVLGEPSWVVTWWYHRAHYFARWRGGPTFEYGQVGSIDWPQLGAPNPILLTYVPSGVGMLRSLEGNELIMDVPMVDVGAPARGAKLDHITAYTWSEHGPQPTTVDEAKSFSYVLGTDQHLFEGPDGYVQVSVDDPSFRHPASVSATGQGWEFVTRVLARGRHTIYVRQVLSAALYAPAVWDDVVAGPVAKVSVTVR